MEDGGHKPPPALHVGRPRDDQRLWLRDDEEISEASTATDAGSDSEGIPASYVNATDWRGRLHGGKENSRYKVINPDVVLSDKQKGLYMSISEQNNPEKHVQKAIEFANVCSNKFQFSKESGFPRDLEAANKFAATATDEEIVNRMDRAIEYWSERSEFMGYGSLAREDARRLGVPSVFNARVLQEMLVHIGAGRAEIFCERLRNGSRLVGIFDNPGVFPRRKGKNKKPKRLDIETVDDLRLYQVRILEDIKRIAAAQDASDTDAFWADAMEDGCQMASSPYELSPYARRMTAGPKR